MDPRRKLVLELKTSIRAALVEMTGEEVGDGVEYEDQEPCSGEPEGVTKKWELEPVLFFFGVINGVVCREVSGVNSGVGVVAIGLRRLGSGKTILGIDWLVVMFTWGHGIILSGRRGGRGRTIR
jgi:hypothetical protein